MEQLSISDAIRYVLIGFVGFFCYAFLFPEATKESIEKIGAFPLTGFAMAGGAVFFFLYDALLLPQIHCVKDLVGNAQDGKGVKSALGSLRLIREKVDSEDGGEKRMRTFSRAVNCRYETA